MRWDRFMYLLESSSTERYQLQLGGILIHLKDSKPHHQSLCNVKARNFITKDIKQVTCEKCAEIYAQNNPIRSKNV